MRFSLLFPENFEILSCFQSLLFPERAVHQQDQLQHTAEALLPVLFPPVEYSLPAGVLPEQDLQLEGSLIALTNAVPEDSLIGRKQQGGEAPVEGIGLGLIEEVQHVLHQNEKPAETGEGLGAAVGAVEPSPEDSVCIGIDADYGFSVSGDP